VAPSSAAARRIVEAEPFAMTSAQELEKFFEKYDPKIVAQAKQARKKLQKLLPKATELVYDNYNALVIAFGAGEKMSEIVLSIALYPRWVTLFFMNGAKLKDPKKLLEGGGKQIRGIRSPDLEDPDVIALIRQASAKSKFEKRELIIRSISKKQRPRRPK
jgi:hypothetical protein